MAKDTAIRYVVSVDQAIEDVSQTAWVWHSITGGTFIQEPFIYAAEEWAEEMVRDPVTGEWHLARLAKPSGAQLKEHGQPYKPTRAITAAEENDAKRRLRQSKETQRGLTPS